MRFSGDCFGVEVRRRGSDGHVEIALAVEDDEFWHEKLVLDAAWLPELIRVLQEAQTAIERQGQPAIINGKQCGWILP